MFCPKCKTEYRTGFTICADCEIPLIYKLPPETPVVIEQKHANVKRMPSEFNLKNIVLLKIFSSSIEANLACGLLEGAGIEVYEISEGVGQISGFRSAPAAEYAVYVNREDVRLAEELLRMPNEKPDVTKKESGTENILRRVLPLGLAAFFLMIAYLPMKTSDDPPYMRYLFIGFSICFLLIFFLTFIRKQTKH